MQPHNGKNALNPARRHLVMQPHDGKNALNLACRCTQTSDHKQMSSQAQAQLIGTGTQARLGGLVNGSGQKFE